MEKKPKNQRILYQSIFKLNPNQLVSFAYDMTDSI